MPIAVVLPQHDLAAEQLVAADRFGGQLVDSSTANQPNGMGNGKRLLVIVTPEGTSGQALPVWSAPPHIVYMLRFHPALLAPLVDGPVPASDATAPSSSEREQAAVDDE